MKKTDKIIIITIISLTISSFFSCYNDFKEPAGYANYYFDNRSGEQVYLEYKISEEDGGEERMTSIIFPDSMVNFHIDQMTGQNPEPGLSFQWLKVYERVNDTTNVLTVELDPVPDSLWTNEQVDNFDPGERNWYLTYPIQ
ncbi:MAG: hypothetical protein K9H84_05265 [Bacteroidales bacterium]|nr:hypothetical protein [Bacteroidales bacterium]